MKLIKTKKKKKFFLFKILILAFCIYFIVLLVNQQMQLNKKKAELNEINEKISIQEIKNEEMRQIVDSDETKNKNYIERIARESLDFAKRGERVFINILGN